MNKAFLPNRALLLCGTAVLLAAPAHAALVVSGGATSNMSCASGVCTATAANAVLNAGDLQTMLGAGDVTVATGAPANDIKITAPVSWPGTSRLTLDAQRSIAIAKAVRSTGTGAMTLTTNDGGSGGDLSFSGAGHVEFWDLASGLTVGGQSYTLVGDVASLASAVGTNPSGAYALARSYDASADGTYALAPVQTTLLGKFEGLGNAISRLKIKVNLRATAANAGLFSALGTGSLVRDLKLTKASVSLHVRQHGAGTTGTGVLAGASDGEIAHVETDGHVTSNVTFNAGIGGVVGTMFSGVLRDSRAAVTVEAHALKGTAFAGGLVGTLETGSVLRGAATGSVTATADGQSATAGGLIGSVDQATIAQSWASGPATATGHDDALAGGLIGSNARGSLSDDTAGGNATATASTHNGYAGGLIGEAVVAPAAVATSYATGTAGATGSVGQFSGGLIGFNNGAASANYWDVDTSGTALGSHGNTAGITGVSDGTLRAGVPAGFDAAVWAQNGAINGGYPYLKANQP